MIKYFWPAVAGLLACLLSAASAQAQDGDQPRRTRVALGAKVVPSYPGSDDVSLRPLVDVSRARGDQPFEFEAADDSFGFAVVRQHGFELGPALGFQGSRKPEDGDLRLPKVGFTLEAGLFAQYALSGRFRVRAEARKGVGGHRGLIGTVGADYIARDRDRWLLSIGPRLTFADDRYQRAYFSVAPQDSAVSGLPAFAAKGGLQAVGLTAGLIKQLSRKWGIYSYAKYDRLVGDAADSPVVRLRGSADQLSGGVALTYTF